MIIEEVTIEDSRIIINKRVELMRRCLVVTKMIYHTINLANKLTIVIATTNNSNNSMTITEIIGCNMGIVTTGEINNILPIKRRELLTIWLGSRDLIIRITTSCQISITKVVVLLLSSTGVKIIIVKDNREGHSMMNI